MDIASTILTSSVVGVVFSGMFGFIQFLITRHDKNKETQTNTCLIVQQRHEQAFHDMEGRIDKLTAICTGLAYDRIMHTGEKYLKQGYITVDEREGFRKYLWQPYHDAGGNGSGDAMMKALDELPIEKEVV